jgi:hypothetical protein
VSPSRHLRHAPPTKQEGRPPLWSHATWRPSPPPRRPRQSATSHAVAAVVAFLTRRKQTGGEHQLTTQVRGGSSCQGRLLTARKQKAVTVTARIDQHRMMSGSAVWKREARTRRQYKASSVAAPWRGPDQASEQQQRALAPERRTHARATAPRHSATRRVPQTETMQGHQ